ncbi:RNA-directed DNA polymerase (Reverse transcriptase) [Chthoniobacter flavus Ellin428]|uniref:RNA-directed DNA polymerase (Reverse transcriptase) n=1 Tax=Chthoniobacter flavus Ellin428 TaxID=497964 RepID=B4CYA7_9BACT|nr:group II intron reverse transcriptase/maturase [Chthoniobacter flavus]EDY20448.1 RNA-directed DNA polymerase (Reverse transcriptase) [Chthoniobacter flavus Ellin428]TCO85608.1 group II intron reverse transcriptase/maturase [Chthoniobacter flavus]
MKIDVKHLRTSESVRKLQSSLQAKAKTEPSYRFYSLWDKVCRGDFLVEAYRRCRRNGGSAGVDGETFEQIEAAGLDAWLGKLQEELRTKQYRTQPLLRVWIPKSNGGQRPLGIPTVRDRVVQMATVMVLGPIFETDLCEEQMGFRPGRDAKTAVRLVYYQVRQKGRQEVVDADLSDYFNTVPHGALMKSLSRRIADGQVLSVIARWLEAPVEECTPDGRLVRSTPAKDAGRGTPQGGVISPLLANVYFRRFVLAWKQLGYEQAFDSVIVNYADDFVICCRPGNGNDARKAMTRVMGKIGLTVNEQKTKVVRVPGESFDFLGYTIGGFYGQGGKPYIGTRPSKKAILRIMGEIHEQTSSQWNASEPETRVKVLNEKLRGWAGYFNQGPVIRIYLWLQNYTDRRLRRWLMRRRQQRGTGYRQYPDEYLYERLGLYRLPRSRVDQSKAKAGNSEMRAGCGKSARPVRGAGTGNGATDENEAPALW